MSIPVTRIVLPTVAVMMLGFAVNHVASESRVETEPPPPATPPRAPFGLSVAATGIVEARSENIAIGSALPGIVAEVYVSSDRVGSRVAAGMPLFRVDDRHLKAQLAAHRATLRAQQAQLAKLEAMPRREEVPPIEAKVRAAESDLVLTSDALKRELSLRNRQVNTEENVVQRTTSRDGALHRLEQARAELALLRAGAWNADIEVARANVAQAQSVVDQDLVEIDRAIVRAPVDGDLLKVDVRPGEAVSTAPGKALVMLGDLKQLRIRVEIDEEDIPRFRANRAARACSRGDASQTRSLRFVRVEPYVVPKRSLAGETTERVDTRVLQVIYEFEDIRGGVHVGQQMDVYLDASTESQISE